MPQLRMVGAIQPRITAGQNPPFSKSALPLMTELGGLFRRGLVSILGRRISRWPFDDRLLVWLVPDLIPAASAFHAGKGKPLVGLYNAHELSTLDLRLLERLAASLEHLQPGTISSLKRAPTGMRSRWVRLRHGKRPDNRHR